MSDSEGIEKLILSRLSDFVGYSASTSPDTLEGKVDVPLDRVIKLNANENPYGCSPGVLRALAACTDIHVYPDDGQQSLRRLLAGYTGVDAANIVAGPGSNTLIDFIVRLFIGTGDEVINCVPTFDIYRFSTQICGGTLVNVNRDAQFAVDVKAVKNAISSKTKLIFLATPNNPTGNAIPQKDILEIVETDLPVVVDEAYYEFGGETVLPLTASYQNLMVLRSFSKWAGLAGLRVGYGVFTPRIADRLMSIKIPHNVSVVAEIAVRESLADLDYLRDRVNAVIAERERLYEALGKLSLLKPYPSKANFIFCQVLKGSASGLYNVLQRRGILVRYFDTPLLKDSVRISVGKPEHTDALISVLREIEGS